MNRLSGYTESVSDLLPGPALFPGGADLVCFDLLREPVQGADGAQSHSGIRRSESILNALVHSVSLA